MLKIEFEQEDRKPTWYELEGVDQRYHKAIAEAERWVFEWRQIESGAFVGKMAIAAMAHIIPIFAFNGKGQNRLAATWREFKENEAIRERLFHFIEHGGLIAPFLTNHWHNYRDIVGEYRCLGELQFAYCMNFPMADLPLDLAHQQADLDPDNWGLWEPAEFAMMPKLNPHWATPLLPPSPVIPNPPIVALPPTVDVTPALPGESSAAEHTGKAPFPQIERQERQVEDRGLNEDDLEDEVSVEPNCPNLPDRPVDNRYTPEMPTALSVVLADPYQCRSLFGSQRTGKSYFAAVASQEINKNYKTNVYHINLVSYGDEDGYYWGHTKRSLCCDISSMSSYEAAFWIEQAVDLVNEFYLDQNPALLIIDEFAYIGSTGNSHKIALAKLLCLIADKITTLSSSGKKRCKTIWAIAPEFVAGSLTQDAKSIKKLQLLYLSINPQKSVDWNGQKIGFDYSLFDQIKYNFEITEPYNLPEDDRVAFVNGHWLPLGDLPALNSSRCDRKQGKSKQAKKDETEDDDPWNDQPPTGTINDEPVVNWFVNKLVRVLDRAEKEKGLKLDEIKVEDVIDCAPKGTSKADMGFILDNAKRQLRLERSVL